MATPCCWRARPAAEKTRPAGCANFTVSPSSHDNDNDNDMSNSENKYPVIFGTEDLLTSLCQSVSKVLSITTQTDIHYSGMVQRISKTCLKPDIGCFVLFDGGFSGLVLLNFTAAAALELYESYMLNMGMSKSDLTSSYASDEVSNVMGELMNQVLGDFTGKVRRELQTDITQNQPKMLAINKQVVLSVDANLDQPESRRVTFYTSRNNIFYLELSVDKTEFIQLHDFEPQAAPNPDELMAQLQGGGTEAPARATPQPENTDNDDLLKSLGM
jgi:CheY-specific phosphatase CheX